MRAGVVFCLGVGVGVVVALCIMRRSQSKVKLVEDKNQAEVGPTASGKIANDSDGDVLKTEQVSRNRLFFGDGGQTLIEGSFVVVVGLGGVGSHAANMLARAGVGKLRLIDFDQVTLSSLNRHAIAIRSDVGLPKSTVMRDRLHSIVPFVNIEAVRAIFEASVADELLAGNPDYVLDCIDDVRTKCELLTYCVQHNIRVITSFGAGAKADPSQLHIALDYADVTRDALASKVRSTLRKSGIDAPIPAVYSCELASRKLCPLDQSTPAHELGAIDNFRVRVLPVLGPMPAIFGNAMAAYVLCQLAQQPFAPSEVPALWQPRTIRLMLEALIKREREVFNNVDVDLTEDDIEFIVRDVWHFKSPGNGKMCSHALTRWRYDEPPSITNVVLLTIKEVNQLDKRHGNPTDVIPADAIARIERRLACVPAMWASR